LNSNFYIKTNRAFTLVRTYAWLLTLLIAFAGLWIPKLGLLVLPIMAALTLTSFFKGRYWCGNFCPHGSLFDNIYIKVSNNKSIHAIFKSKITRVVFFSWFGFQLTRRFIKAFASFGTESFLDKVGFIFVMTYLMVLAISLITSTINNSRSWCNICPMGTIQTVSYKLGKLLGATKKTDQKVTIKDKNMCHTCGKCSRVCPMQLEPHTEFSENNQFDDEACIRCSTCVNNCPAGILTLSTLEFAVPQSELKPEMGYDNRQKITARIVKVNDIGNSLKEYIFKFISPEKVKYSPGQFILMKIQENPVMYRAYSISSYDKNGETLGVIIKKAHKGYGTDIIFKSFTEGSIVELDGPMGGELLIDHDAENLVFVANGVGVTPFIPLVEEAVNSKGKTRKVTFVSGARNENEFIYDEYFEEMSQNSHVFEYVRVASNPIDDAHRTGYVSDVLRNMDLSATKIYMCGSKAMIDGMRKLLREKSVSDDDIFYESA
jgi:NAD(P)H-flavin reductase/NAD-dependent dihydropyrimidine dehydrogenase PreA subunit